ncbi:MAG: hypothetical protein QOG85_831 [Gaiellaceae bacterium]|jgi:hypothetical protein|nr:hypothetical protein [Gaiellaceae bacterium]
MKALSLRQPWAWAVIHGGKRVENRVWNTKFRGSFLIHASAGCTAWEYVEATRWMADRGLVRMPGHALGAMEEILLRVADVDLEALPVMPPLRELARGGIVGRARLADVLAPAIDGQPRRPWHMPEQYGFVLEDVLELDFRPVKGNRRWFNVPDVFGSVTMKDSA